MIVWDADWFAAVREGLWCFEIHNQSGFQE